MVRLSSSGDNMLPREARQKEPLTLIFSNKDDDSSVMSDIANIGLRGIQQGLESAALNSVRVVEAFLPESTEDAVVPILALQSDKRKVQASALVIQTAEKMTGAILDILG